MIIPVRCFDCGKVLADKWVAYASRCREAGEDVNTPASVATPDDAKRGDNGGNSGGNGGGNDGNGNGGGNKTMSVRGHVLDDLGITRMCCRIVMLSHVDLCDDI
jgi:DNA-directed RNA polymerase subunit N (RpoN/RPB10)